MYCGAIESRGWEVHIIGLCIIDASISGSEPGWRESAVIIYQGYIDLSSGRRTQLRAHASLIY